ncbi:hypothetical protein F2Q69_00052635 [Brassica cretica]|uniref:Uncharacterized protein n=1 Tax=Brassica cretica TaxID=69181 RepID=A0A8S9N2D5_BRACR|nr:hypothetical protein F2Q69_00052635 [Brassica cretica]
MEPAHHTRQTDRALYWTVPHTLVFGTEIEQVQHLIVATAEAKIVKEADKMVEPNFQYNNYQQKSYSNNQQNGYQPRNNQQGSYQPQQNLPPGFSNKGNQSSQQQANLSTSTPQESSTDVLLKHILESQTRSEKQVGYELKNLHSKIDRSYNELNNKFRALENQFASMTTHQNRQQGSLPEKSEQKLKEYCNVVLSTTSSGIELSNHKKEVDEIERLVFGTETEQVEHLIVATAEAKIMEEAHKMVEAKILKGDEPMAEKPVAKRANQKLKEVKLEDTTEVEHSPYDKLPFPQRVLTKAQKKNGYQPRNKQQGSYQPQQNPPPGFSNKGNQSSQQQANLSTSTPQESNTDVLLKQILESRTRSEKQVGYELKNLHSTIDGSYNELNNKFRALENQFAYMTIHQNRQQGSLPRKSEQKPKEYCNVVLSTTSSGIELSNHKKEVDEIERLMFGTEIEQVEHLIVARAEAKIVEEADKMVEAKILKGDEPMAEKPVAKRANQKLKEVKLEDTTEHDHFPRRASNDGRQRTWNYLMKMTSKLQGSTMDLRTNPFEEGGNDVPQSTNQYMEPNQHGVHDVLNISTEVHVFHRTRQTDRALYWTVPHTSVLELSLEPRPRDGFDRPTSLLSQPIQHSKTDCQARFNLGREVSEDVHRFSLMALLVRPACPEGCSHVLASVPDPLMDFSLLYFTKALKLICPRLVSRQYTSWTSG